MSNISAAPVAFKMNDVEYLMSPLTDRDIDELNNFIKQGILSAAKEFCENTRSQDIINATMKAAMDKVSSIDWLTNPDLLETAENVTYLLWMGARNNNPKPTRGEFKKAVLLDWSTNFDLCMEILQLVNPFLLKKKESQDQSNQTQENPS